MARVPHRPPPQLERPHLPPLGPESPPAKRHTQGHDSQRPPTKTGTQSHLGHRHGHRRLELMWEDQVWLLKASPSSRGRSTERLLARSESRKPSQQPELQTFPRRGPLSITATHSRSPSDPLLGVHSPEDTPRRAMLTPRRRFKIPWGPSHLSPSFLVAPATIHA